METSQISHSLTKFENAWWATVELNFFDFFSSVNWPQLKNVTSTITKCLKTACYKNVEIQAVFFTHFDYYQTAGKISNFIREQFLYHVMNNNEKKTGGHMNSQQFCEHQKAPDNNEMAKKKREQED